jgi:hypothetical protein
MARSMQMAKELELKKNTLNKSPMVRSSCRFEAQRAKEEK